MEKAIQKRKKGANFSAPLRVSQISPADSCWNCGSDSDFCFDFGFGSCFDFDFYSGFVGFDFGFDFGFDCDYPFLQQSLIFCRQATPLVWSEPIATIHRNGICFGSRGKFPPKANRTQRQRQRRHRNQTPT